MKKNHLSIQLESYGLSDIGLIRDNNEDFWTELLKEQCFILADGMGGHQAGEIAAKETVETLALYVKKLGIQAKQLTPKELSDWIKKAILETNAHIYALSLEKREYHGMGTTLCLAFVLFPYLVYAHVGDSRIYRIRNQQIERLTQDHSLKDEMIAKGELNKKDAHYFPYRNVITRAIGTQSSVQPDIQTTHIVPEDIYLLCSDGLTDALSDEEILETILAYSNLKAAAERLIQKSKDKGGNDNITVILVKPS